MFFHKHFARKSIFLHSKFKKFRFRYKLWLCSVQKNLKLLAIIILAFGTYLFCLFGVSDIPWVKDQFGEKRLFGVPEQMFSDALCWMVILVEKNTYFLNFLQKFSKHFVPNSIEFRFFVAYMMIHIDFVF